MKVLVDTNVVLDVLLDRRPHSGDAAHIFKLVEEGRLQGLLCATTITTIDYLLIQSLSRSDARKHLAQLIRLFDIAPVNRAVIERAMRSRITDFEDAVLEQAAVLAGAEAIITRNAKDFAQGATVVLDPRQCLVQLGE